MNDIISALSATHDRAFVSLLDETNAKISPLWETCRQDVSNTALLGKNYCLCSYAFTGTVNFKKTFPNTFKDKSASTQVAYMRTKIKHWIKNKPIQIVLYWELAPKNLAVHCHGIIHAYPAMIDKFSKYWKRNIGFSLLKPLDNIDKWKEYCEKDSRLHLAVPTYVL